MLEHSLVIIPTYNEALNAQMLLEKIFELYPEISVLVIDDNSPDKTYHIIEIIKFKYPKLSLIKRDGKNGLGTAYVEGFKWALAKKFKYIVQMDCDLSHDPKDIKQLIETIKDKNADLVIGSRYFENNLKIQNWKTHRKILSVTASLMLRTFTGVRLMDLTGGFKCFNRLTLEKMNLDQIISKGFIFQFETNYRVHQLGLKIIEIPITFNQRILGNSKMSLEIILESIVIFFKLRF